MKMKIMLKSNVGVGLVCVVNKGGHAFFLSTNPQNSWAHSAFVNPQIS
jgi:hypothetical protein